MRLYSTGWRNCFHPFQDLSTGLSKVSKIYFHESVKDWIVPIVFMMSYQNITRKPANYTSLQNKVNVHLNKCFATILKKNLETFLGRDIHKQQFHSLLKTVPWVEQTKKDISRKSNLKIKISSFQCKSPSPRISQCASMLHDYSGCLQKNILLCWKQFVLALNTKRRELAEWIKIPWDHWTADWRVTLEEN